MDWYRPDTDSIDTYIGDTYYPGLSTQGEGIDLRTEMNYILYGKGTRKPKGHWVIYRSYDRSKPSENYSSDTHEGVGGPAWEYTDTLLRTRRVPVRFRGDPLDPVKAGIAVSDNYVYYFEYTVNPKRGDHIIELIWDDHSVKPTLSSVPLLERYIIRGTHPYRLENGNIQYWATTTEFDEIGH